jgi:iron complex outermembrane receptor protein
LTRDPGSRDVSQERRNEGQTPHHQFETQTSFDLPRRVELDWIFRYISALPGAAVPAYGTWDARAGWQPTPHVELAVVGQDLQDAHHLEWPGGAEIRRSGSVMVTLRW